MQLHVTPASQEALEGNPQVTPLSRFRALQCPEALQRRHGSTFEALHVVMQAGAPGWLRSGTP